MIGSKQLFRSYQALTRPIIYKNLLNQYHYNNQLIYMNQRHFSDGVFSNMFGKMQETFKRMKETCILINIYLAEKATKVAKQSMAKKKISRSEALQILDLSDLKEHEITPELVQKVFFVLYFN